MRPCPRRALPLVFVIIVGIFVPTANAFLDLTGTLAKFSDLEDYHLILVLGGDDGTSSVRYESLEFF